MSGPMVVVTHARSAGIFSGGHPCTDTRALRAPYFLPGRTTSDTHRWHAGFFLFSLRRTVTHRSDAEPWGGPLVQRYPLANRPLLSYPANRSATPMECPPGSFLSAIRFPTPVNGALA